MAGKFQTDFFIHHASTELTIDAGGGFITITQGFHTVASAAGPTDDLSSIVLGTGISNLFSDGLPYIILKAATGHTISIQHDAAPSTDEIYLVNGADFEMSGSRLVKLYRVDNIWTDALAITRPNGGFAGLTSPDITTPTFNGLETAIGVYKFANLDALGTGQTIIVPSRTGKRFVPTAASIELANVSGAGTEPSINLGSDSGTWINVVANVALTGLDTQYELFDLTLVGNSVDVGSTGISIDIDTAATGFTDYDINVYVMGFYRS
jgi:hypothetical protein